MDVILLGAPGAGKGTQATELVKEYGLVHISTGDLFRAALRDQTALGIQAKSYMDKGELVPDEVVIGMVEERINQPDCAGGVLFDGFPRTVEQADALQRVLAQRQRRIDGVISISVSNDVLLKRIAGRLTCRECGAVFNRYFHPPKQEGICDVCGASALFQRPDDNEDTAKNRLDVYFKQTAPLISYYREQGTLHEVDGERDMAAVTADVLRVLRS